MFNVSFDFTEISTKSKHFFRFHHSQRINVPTIPTMSLGIHSESSREICFNEKDVDDPKYTIIVNRQKTKEDMFIVSI